MQKLVMFNGPPRAGKDTAGKICQEFLGENMTLTKFTTAVKDYAHETLGLNCSSDFYEALKDVKLKEFNGLTPREYYISTSEMLRAVDIEAVSKMLLDLLPDIKTDYVINTDVGMDYEAQGLVDYFGAENCLLVRINRDGKSFENDCRTWVKEPAGCSVVEIQNSTKEDFHLELNKIIEDFCLETTCEMAM